MKLAKRARFTGFSTASEVLAASGSVGSPAMSTAEETPEVRKLRPESNRAAIQKENVNVNQAIPCAQTPDTPFQVTLTLKGTEFYPIDARTMLLTGTSVLVARQPDNEFDHNAIRVFLAAQNSNEHGSDGTRPTIGHVSRQQAALLAPYLDAGMIRFRSISIIQNSGGTSYDLKADGLAHMTEELQLVLDNPLFQKIVDVGSLSHGLAKLDLAEAQKAHYSLDHLRSKATQWSPLPNFSQNNSTHAWEPFDACAVSQITVENAVAIQETQWPPSDEVMKMLGLAPANDRSWWGEVAGLKPPTEWNVSGALDLLHVVKVRSQAHRDKAEQELDGAVHGVTNVWLDETLRKMREAMHQPAFWCHRGGDAFIRAFGGPYVLGQEEGKLKLVRGAPHTDLTAKICRAHNLVYCVTHLAPPAAPGFNTIIFGLNLRRAGFHYHQDSIGELKPKNAPLLPRQPVVTTVFYEHPDLDNEKEVVLWRPMLNWSPSEDQTNPETDVKSSEGEGTSNCLYLAARCVPTTHGMIHVQRAGLQARTKHGIFHAPRGNSKEADDEEEGRVGYRVAITARIARPDAEEKLEPFVESNSYAKIFGPEGEWQIPKSTNSVG